MKKIDTILGAPVVDGRAETVLGGVTITNDGPWYTVARWTPTGVSGDVEVGLAGPTEEPDVIAEADRVLTALRDRVRADALREAAEVGQLLLDGHALYGQPGGRIAVAALVEMLRNLADEAGK